MQMEPGLSALWKAWLDTKPAVQSEPAHVYNLFCSPAAIWHWGTRLRAAVPKPIPVCYQAVFAHKKPRVRFTFGAKGYCCELGDLLLVTSRAKLGFGFDRRALLLQAKMSGGRWPEAGDQWELYTRWPSFAYSLQVGKQRQQRKGVSFTPPPAPLSCARYLILDPVNRELAVREATPATKERGLLLTLGGVFLGTASRHIEPVAKSAVHSDWSRTVWDLIEFIGPQPLRPTEASAAVSATRGSEIVSFLGGAAPPRSFRGVGDTTVSVTSGFAVVHVAIGAPPIPELSPATAREPTDDWFWE